MCWCVTLKIEIYVGKSAQPDNLKCATQCVQKEHKESIVFGISEMVCEGVSGYLILTFFHLFLH